jgi:GntR family transcriptional regulator, transcriptional repressor for pyruvate dehydrogenase complex
MRKGHVSLKPPKTLSETIADELTRKIIQGRYAPGSRLPTEREMAESFQVTRHVVREALKRIHTLGLIEIRQGSGAIVQDYLETGGLELADYLVTDEQHHLNMDFIRDLIDVHEMTNIFTVRIAIERMTDDEFETFQDLVGQLTEKSNRGEPVDDLVFELTIAIVHASKNGYIRMLFNSLRRSTSLFPTLFVLPGLIAPETAGEMAVFFNDLVTARMDGNPEMAEAKAADMFRKYKEKAISQLEVFLQDGTSLT